MNWTEILNWILGGTSLLGVVGTIVYRKQTKTIKESEATQSKVEAQKAEIELADLYKQKMLEMMELINVKQDKGNVNQERMLAKLENIDSRVDNLESRMGNVEGCLNGTLTAWVAEHSKEKEIEVQMKNMMEKGDTGDE